MDSTALAYLYNPLKPYHWSQVRHIRSGADKKCSKDTEKALKQHIFTRHVKRNLKCESRTLLTFSTKQRTIL